MTKRQLTWLSDAEWLRIEPLLPRGRKGAHRVDDRRVISGIVQLIGDDAMNTPPAHALARRGHTGNVVGYMLYGDYRQPNPPAAIVTAVGKGDIDVGLIWGPLAGYFAKKARVPLRLEPVTPWLDDAQWPMNYEISMGVRKDEPKLRADIEAALARHRRAINALLADYGVPMIGQAR